MSHRRFQWKSPKHKQRSVQKKKGQAGSGGVALKLGTNEEDKHPRRILLLSIPLQKHDEAKRRKKGADCRSFLQS